MVSHTAHDPGPAGVLSTQSPSTSLFGEMADQTMENLKGKYN